MNRSGDWFKPQPKRTEPTAKKRPAWLEDLLTHAVPELGEGESSTTIIEAAKRGDAAAIARIVRRAESWMEVLCLIEREAAAKPVLKKLAEERVCWPMLVDFPAGDKWVAQVRKRVKELRLGARRSDARKRPRDLPWLVNLHASRLSLFIIGEAERLGCTPDARRAKEAGWKAWLGTQGGDVLIIPGILEHLFSLPGFPEKNGLTAWERRNPRPRKSAPVSRKIANEQGREIAEASAARKPVTEWERRRRAEQERIYKRQRAWMGKQRAAVKRQLLAAAVARLGGVTPDESTG